MSPCTAISTVGHVECGRGVAHDHVQAVAWWRKAADLGVADAQHNLSAMYYEGLVVPQDYVEALKWGNLAVSRARGDPQVPV